MTVNMDINSLLEENYLILSVVGSHAGESEKEIFDRKRREIAEVGKSFWLITHLKQEQMLFKTFVKMPWQIVKEFIVYF